MKIGEAKKIYSPQLDTLWNRKRELAKLLKEESAGEMDGSRYDRVELSHELSQVEKQYSQMQAFMEQLQLKESCVHNAEVAKQQSEVMTEVMDEMIKCFEIAGRISEGAKVPPEDEKKLMEYSPELYAAAKNMASMKEQTERKEYDSLVEEEERGPKDSKTASEIASDTEINMELPELVSEGISTEESSE